MDNKRIHKTVALLKHASQYPRRRTL